MARRGGPRRRKVLLYATLVVSAVIGVMALIAWSATRATLLRGWALVKVEPQVWV